MNHLKNKLINSVAAPTSSIRIDLENVVRKKNYMGSN
jgi:hypothetical protein